MKPKEKRVVRRSYGDGKWFPASRRQLRAAIGLCPEDDDLANHDVDEDRRRTDYAKAAFIREEMRQTGCLAIEAARRYNAIQRRSSSIEGRWVEDSQ